MIPTMQPPIAGWNPETQHVRSNGVGRQTDPINNFGFNPFGGYPVAVTPTLTPYGSTGYLPTATQFPGTIPTPYGTVAVSPTMPYNPIPTQWIQTPYGIIPAACATIPTNYGMIPSMNPLAINPFVNPAMINPFMTGVYPTTNPYHVAATIANCANGLCLQPAATIPTTVVTPFGNVSFPNIGNPFFRPMGTLGGIDAINTVVGSPIHGLPVGLPGIANNPYIGFPINGQTPTAIGPTPFQTLTTTPLGQVCNTTPYGNLYNTPFQTITQTTPFGAVCNTTLTGAALGTPFNTLSTSPFGIPHNPINATIAPGIIPTTGGTINPWISGLSPMSLGAAINACSTTGMINPLANALIAQGLNGGHSVNGFQYTGISPFSGINSAGCTPWNTTAITGVNPITGTPAFINPALTNPASLFASAMGCPIC